jgi:hypothetical protein
MSIIISTSIASALSVGFNEALQSSQFVAWKKMFIAGVLDGVFVADEESLDGDNWRRDEGRAQNECRVDCWAN